MAGKMEAVRAKACVCATKLICLLLLASLPCFAAAARKIDMDVRPRPPAIPDGTPSAACDPQAFTCFPTGGSRPSRRMATTQSSNKYELQAFRPTYPGHSPGVGHDNPPTR